MSEALLKNIPPDLNGAGEEASDLRLLELKALAIKRGAAYLEGAGFSPELALGEASRILSQCGNSLATAGLSVFMAAIQHLAEAGLPTAANRPLKLGHMLAADFKRRVAVKEAAFQAAAEAGEEWEGQF